MCVYRSVCCSVCCSVFEKITCVWFVWEAFMCVIRVRSVCGMCDKTCDVYVWCVCEWCVCVMSHVMCMCDETWCVISHVMCMCDKSCDVYVWYVSVRCVCVLWVMSHVMSWAWHDSFTHTYSPGTSHITSRLCHVCDTSIYIYHTYFSNVCDTWETQSHGLRKEGHITQKKIDRNYMCVIRVRSILVWGYEREAIIWIVKGKAHHPPKKVTCVWYVWEVVMLRCAVYVLQCMCCSVCVAVCVAECVTVCSMRVAVCVLQCVCCSVCCSVC